MKYDHDQLLKDIAHIQHMMMADGLTVDEIKYELSNILDFAWQASKMLNRMTIDVNAIYKKDE